LAGIFGIHLRGYAQKNPAQEYKRESFNMFTSMILEKAVDRYVRPERKVGRNEPCPCGSSKKYKQCHGKIRD